MRLRNKKTGKVFDALIREKGGLGSYSHIVCDIKGYEHGGGIKANVLGEYNSLTELNEDWEDAKEPLIKDPKIRKAVRAWAEASDIEAVYLSSEALCWIEGFAKIEFAGNRDWYKELEEGKRYTLAELCGEEEE